MSDRPSRGQARHRYAHIGPIDANKPVAGFYRVKLVKGGPWIAVRIWFAPSRDPVTGEELDRSPLWQAERDGREVDIWDVWPRCSVEPIAEAEYKFLIADRAHARQYRPNDPEANPDLPIDLLTVPTPFRKERS